jgi:hypothetical protein
LIFGAYYVFKIRPLTHPPNVSKFSYSVLTELHITLLKPIPYGAGPYDAEPIIYTKATTTEAATGEAEANVEAEADGEGEGEGEGERDEEEEEEGEGEGEGESEGEGKGEGKKEGM